jgi:hypothetical protein
MNLRVLYRPSFLPLIAWLMAALITASGTSVGPCSEEATDGTCYGHDIKRKHFLLDEGFINLNHGSFGAVPKVVGERQHELFLEQGAMC